MSTNALTIMGVGDMFPSPQSEFLLKYAAPVLNSAHIAFGQLEMHYETKNWCKQSNMYVVSESGPKWAFMK